MTCPHCHRPLPAHSPSLLALLGLLAVIGATATVAYQEGLGQREHVVRRVVQVPTFFTSSRDPEPVEPDHEGGRR